MLHEKLGGLWKHCLAPQSLYSSHFALRHWLPLPQLQCRSGLPWWVFASKQSTEGLNLREKKLFSSNSWPVMGPTGAAKCLLAVRLSSWPVSGGCEVQRVSLSSSLFIPSCSTIYISNGKAFMQSSHIHAIRVGPVNGEVLPRNWQLL